MSAYQQGYQDARDDKPHMLSLRPAPLDWTAHKAEDYEQGYSDETGGFKDQLEAYVHDLARFIICDGMQTSNTVRSGRCFYCGVHVEDDLCPGCGARDWDRQDSI